MRLSEMVTRIAKWILRDIEAASMSGRRLAHRLLSIHWNPTAINRLWLAKFFIGTSASPLVLYSHCITIFR
jgi:hypothetical protein